MLVLILLILLFDPLNLKKLIGIQIAHIYLKQGVAVDQVLDERIHLTLDQELHLALGNGEGEAHLHGEGDEFESDHFSLGLDREPQGRV